MWLREGSGEPLRTHIQIAAELLGGGAGFLMFGACMLLCRTQAVEFALAIPLLCLLSGSRLGLSLPAGSVAAELPRLLGLTPFCGVLVLRSMPSCRLLCGS